MNRWLWPLVFLGIVAWAPAQAVFDDSQLQGELWMPLQPLLPGELERRATDPEKLDALLEEMQTVFSGMVYGWSFDYRPGAPERHVADRFDMNPLGRIVGTTGQVGTARAWAWATHLDESSGVVTVDFRYIMTPLEQARRSAWASANLDSSSGTGQSTTLDRLESRMEALRQALRNAIRNLLRPEYYNRPEEIRGEALLREVPRFTIQAGRYVCTATFQIRILAVRQYPF